MADTPILPPDRGTPHRVLVNIWDRLWHGDYKYDTANRSAKVDAAPGYTRSFSNLIAGLFQRQPPAIDAEQETITPAALSALLHEMVAKGAGFGSVLLRPVFDGTAWVPSVLSPTRFAVEWAHRTPLSVTMWDFAADPRSDDDKVGLAIIEYWVPTVGEPGHVETAVWSTKIGASGTELVKQVSVESPPAGLEDHPFILSAANDAIPRDMIPFVWGWEDFGPAALWYTNESVIDGLARLWDQEQDDAELTRKRIAIPTDSLGRASVTADGTSNVIARPGFNKHDNLLLLSSAMSTQHGADGGVTPIEFGDDLTQRERIERRENALLEMAGINPASIGRNVGGRSDSASAKRADNQMTMNTVTAPARAAESSLTAMVNELARLTTDSTVTGLVVSVSEGLKENPVESAETARALRDADAASTATLVRTAHPTWDEGQVDAEVETMQAENLATSPLEF